MNIASEFTDAKKKKKFGCKRSRSTLYGSLGWQPNNPFCETDSKPTRWEKDDSFEPIHGTNAPRVYRNCFRKPKHSHVVCLPRHGVLKSLLSVTRCVLFSIYFRYFLGLSIFFHLKLLTTVVLHFLCLSCF